MANSHYSFWLDLTARWIIKCAYILILVSLAAATVFSALGIDNSHYGEYINIQNEDFYQLSVIIIVLFGVALFDAWDEIRRDLLIEKLRSQNTELRKRIG